MTGKSAAGFFAGHTDSVRSVAFSPDGQHIVSGSNDLTIRVWNVMIGEASAGPLTGHRTVVNYKAFLPDGSKNIIPSSDRLMINGEGWIYGGKGELLMWIPLVHREYFHRTIWISGKRKTILSLSKFEHGRSWAACFNTLC
jgi:hypothetical protein